MKKTILLLLCLLLLTGSALAEEYVSYENGYDVVWEDGDSDSGADIAQEGMGLTCGDQMSWSLEGSTLYITGSGEMYDFYSGAPWAGYKASINRVVFSDGITYVGAFAFQDYDGITSVEFGSSLVSVGKDAFSGCDGLTSVTLPSSFKKFGENSFRSCSNLKEIHCSGVFPRFDDNCLWDTYATIYYPAANPWLVSLIQQLEEAFHNRIEFRASDGTDPYVPTQATEATVPPATEIPWNTEALPQVTQPVQTQPTIPVYTEATVPVYTPPTTVETLPVQTLPPATQATISFGDLETRQPEPYRPAATDGSSIFGVLIVLIMLCILVTGALLFRSAGGSKRKKRNKYRR